ncbi:lipoprotein signal peptidase [Spiroplasma chinense]|uniref:Lipoprotein signal peptidase n=1 Tax=Spiroplasma chinense TaxID=216932 RepID=A0A5B9Y4J4_9MOLU|nr:signal peptidase II [Spiroplasma chinense]QEH62088.1 lipoprotein signal peptidase [Spiroplasma chinense]
MDGIKDLSKNIKIFLKNYNYNWRFKVLWCVPMMVILVAIDWISKAVVSGSMHLGETKTFIPNLLSVNYTINTGAALGMNAGNPTLAITLAAIVTVMLMVAFVFLNTKLWTVAICVMLAGSFGNIIARAWAPVDNNGVRGGVVDFLQWDIDLPLFRGYIFNLADLFVNIAVGLLFLTVVLMGVEEVKQQVFKKNPEKLETYLDFKDKLHINENKYLANVKGKKVKEQWSFYKEYLANSKNIKKDWKEYKKNSKNKQEK